MYGYYYFYLTVVPSLLYDDGGEGKKWIIQGAPRHTATPRPDDTREVRPTTSARASTPRTRPRFVRARSPEIRARAYR